MKLCADDLFDHAGADPIVAVGILGSARVKHLHRRCRRMKRHAKLLPKRHRDRQILVHRIDMTAGAFELPVDDLFQGVVHHTAPRA